MLVFCVLVSGLVYCQLTITLASIHFVGRIIYTIGYRISPKARMIGAPFVMLSCMALLFTTLVASWKLTEGVLADSKTVFSIDL